MNGLVDKRVDGHVDEREPLHESHESLGVRTRPGRTGINEAGEEGHEGSSGRRGMEASAIKPQHENLLNSR